MGKRKKNNPRKRAGNMLKGLIIRWKDETPELKENTIYDGEVDHRNKMMKAMAKHMWDSMGNSLTFKKSFYWRVEITAVFEYDNGEMQREIRELLAPCCLDDLNELALEQIEDAKRYGNIDKFKCVEFEIECLGSQQPKEMEDVA